MSTTIDTTAILVEELAKLGSPLPIPIASHGAANIADDVTNVLIERGQEHYSAAQWRSALREVFRRLTDDKGDVRKRSPNVANRKDQMISLTGRDLLDIRARQILTAKGIYDETAEQYVEALQAAQAEFEEEAKPVVYTGDDGGEALDLCAMKLLRDRGEWNPDADQYLRAVTEAAGILGISLTGRAA